MTEPNGDNEVILTPEHQVIADQIYSRIEKYQQEHYQPATGWPKDSLAYPIRQSLDRADNAAPGNHSHGVDDIEGLEDEFNERMNGVASSSHRHGISDLDGLSVTPERNTIVFRNGDGGFEVIDPARPGQPATKRYVDTEVGKKADSNHRHSLGQIIGLQGQLDSKSAEGHSHSIDDVRGLRDALNNGGSGGSVDPEVLLTKADLVGGTVPTSQIPQLQMSKVTGLNEALASRPQAVDGRFPKSVLPTVNTSDVPGLDDFISAQSNNLKMVGGLVPLERLPGAVFTKALRVSSVEEMLTLTPSQVNSGDVVVVTNGSGVGTYQLIGEPGDLASWLKYASQAAVRSVNGQEGVVTLNASDVGARPAGAIGIGEVTGLTAQLGRKLEESDLDGLPSPLEMELLVNSIPSQNYSYHPVDYVATTRVTSLSGQQTVDGALVPAGRRVLLTNQSSSAQNGIWVTSSTSWYRDNSMPIDSIVPKGALVAVRNGSENANTLWQMRNSAFSMVGTDSQNWHKILTAGGGGVDFTVGDGLRINNNVLSVRAGNNISVTSSGVSLDTTGLMRKYSGNIPAGSSVATVTHNLDTRDVYAAVYEVATGDQVLVGVTITGLNTVAIEFASAPNAGQYRSVIFG